MLMCRERRDLCNGLVRNGQNSYPIKVACLFEDALYQVASICISLLMECKLQDFTKKVNGRVEWETHFITATLYSFQLQKYSVLKRKLKDEIHA